MFYRKYCVTVSSAQLVAVFTMSLVMQQGVHAASCPVSCTCTFHDTLKENKATCNTNNTTVDIKWYRILGHPILSITCEGTNHSCEDLPKFDISHPQAWTEVMSCAPNIVRCFNSIYQQPTIIENMETHNIKGYYTREDLEGLDNVWYVRLYLRDIDTAMPVITIESLPMLKELYIKGGHIYLTKHEYHETQLEYLEMYDNNMYDIPAEAFKGLVRLKKIRIYNNIIAFLNEDSFKGLESLEELNLQGNKVEYLGVGSYSKTILNLSELPTYPKRLHEPSKLFRNAPSLKNINLSNNQITEIPEGTFSMLANIENVYLSHNNIKILFRNLFSFSPQLREIHLDHNAIINIDIHTFNGTRLRKLNLAFNKLQRILRDTKLNWQTKTLNLSSNRLEVFEDWFVDLTDMKKLDLSGNNIKIIKESQFNFPNKKLTIDLRNNNISKIIRNISETDASKGNISLYLSDNPLKCDCEVITLLHEWNENGLILDFEDVICGNNTKISSINIRVHCDRSQELVTVIGSSLIGALVLVIIAISIFTHRAKIWQYLLNITRIK